MFKTFQEDVQFSMDVDPVGGIPQTTVTITIPADNYTSTTLMTLMETLLNIELLVVDANLALTVTLVANRITFTSSGVLDMVIGVGVQSSVIDQLLGIGSSDLVDTLVNPKSLQNSPNLFGVTDVLITSNTLSDNSGTIETNDKFLSSIGHVPIESIFGEYQIYRCVVPEIESVAYNRPKSINSFDIQMRDDQGQILDTQGLNWEMTLKLFY